MPQMLITARLLDASGGRVYEGTTRVSAGGLAQLAAKREAAVREMGQREAAEGLHVLASALVSALQAGAFGRALDDKAISLGMLAWLHDQLFCSVSFEDFRESTLDFTIFANGAVQYQRIRNCPVRT